MSFTHWDKVQWPDQTKIIKGRLRNPTIMYIQNLFNNVGVVTSILYAILVMAIKPILVKQFLQRCELNGEALINLRKLVISLQKKLKTTHIAILGYNEKGNYIERTTQTEEIEETVVDDMECPWVKINENLQELNNDLDTFNKLNQNRSTTNLDFFNLGAKLLAQDINHVDNAGLLADQRTEMVNSIREIKGWFVGGKIR
ncbi:similar to Saccharomyces cerevisiae YNL214W PEX17 Peroxisomal membrane peroxin and subunit of the docking complex that facilitates the import of peroxisomal matrix proteins [Maudiozyma saulgeensis]|uniref:Similar to Saccharomyces cerevisiae YNL214W PEX17 Peroxisomal membrane peroxin and subunit of the docking complex that facilitates the import of peroxisomal matrix proteins n=1 Tax=Maudiozyma saulgeensis TaxID=1789683 RepID=A0A1X7R272_9SACH|nr:similar to Saccharomyces cerevisiae YNL214W PEX17 Peroxisomal membrane peroxin and subunit of the docking complex that facilitates the import of peroxisomal matrix proteins [Kazachstania saulgeensis]